jgi:hypothetical protein
MDSKPECKIEATPPLEAENNQARQLSSIDFQKPAILHVISHMLR